jgi:hypothetical protein
MMMQNKKGSKLKRRTRFTAKNEPNAGRNGFTVARACIPTAQTLPNGLE